MVTTAQELTNNEFNHAPKHCWKKRFKHTYARTHTHKKNSNKKQKV